MSAVTERSEPLLRCRECGEEAPAIGPQYCGWCFGPVEVVLPVPTALVAELARLIATGPESMARYRPLLPGGLALDDAEAGWTPLRRAEALGEMIGVPGLWLKDETANPTGSFKDRVVEAAVARGVSTGARVVACSSTGNLARATAAAAERRGLASVVLVPDHLDDAAVSALVDLGAVVVAVRGGYDAANRLAAEAAADLDQWAWVNVTLRPWYELGARTTGWEIAEQLGWQAPDVVAAPVASGALAHALHESVEHLAVLGLVHGSLPRLVALQPSGCAPVAAAFADGSKVVRPLAAPSTIAASLAMGDPPDGHAVLAAARSTGGVVAAVPEESILEACELVRSTEGIEVEPAGGVVVAGLAQLASAGSIVGDATVVAVLTGGVERHGRQRQRRVVPGGGLAGTIDASVGALTDLLPDALLR